MKMEKVGSAGGRPALRSGLLLTKTHSKRLAPLLHRPHKNCRGGPAWIDNHRVLGGILRILRSVAAWQDLPEEFPHP